MPLLPGWTDKYGGSSMSHHALKAFLSLWLPCILLTHDDFPMPKQIDATGLQGGVAVTDAGAIARSALENDE